MERSDTQTDADDRRPAEPLFRELAGAVLRARRRDRDLRLVDVADRAGVSPQYLSEIERGIKDPSSEVLRAAAAAVGLTLDDLLSDVLDRETDIDAVARPVVHLPVRGMQAQHGEPLCLAA